MLIWKQPQGSLAKWQNGRLNYRISILDGILSGPFQRTDERGNLSRLNFPLGWWLSKSQQQKLSSQGKQKTAYETKSQARRWKWKSHSNYYFVFGFPESSVAFSVGVALCIIFGKTFRLSHFPPSCRRNRARELIIHAGHVNMIVMPAASRQPARTMGKSLGTKSDWDWPGQDDQSLAIALASDRSW